MLYDLDFKKQPMLYHVYVKKGDMRGGCVIARYGMDLGFLVKPLGYRIEL